jgi:hypothetical protein
VKVFEERMEQKMFWGTRDEVRGDWRRLHNEELHDLYFRPNIWMIFSRLMQWAGHVELTSDRRGTYMVLFERPEERRPL